MPKKELTKKQETIVTTMLSGGSHHWSDSGVSNSMRHLHDAGLVTSPYGVTINTEAVTEAGRKAFFRDNPEVFCMRDLGSCWVIFEAGKVVTKMYDEAVAKRLVQGLRLLRTAEATPQPA
jgi:hypothetical protein